MKMLTVICRPFDVVRVPFPFTDQPATRNRPALVLSASQPFNQSTGHAVMAMITSAENPAWTGDVLITDLVAAGLPKPSKVRLKLFTLDLRLLRGVLGHLGQADVARVRQTFLPLLLQPETE